MKSELVKHALGSLLAGALTITAGEIVAGQSIAKPQGTVIGRNPLGPNTDALQQKPFDVLCRGGTGLRVDPAGRRHAMFFQFGKTLPGPYGASLQPGECSPVDRLFTLDEPPGLQFDDKGGEESVFGHRADSNRYWRFAVIKTNYGYFDARSYRRVLVVAEQRVPAVDVAKKAETAKETEAAGKTADAPPNNAALKTAEKVAASPPPPVPSPARVTPTTPIAGRAPAGPRDEMLQQKPVEILCRGGSDLRIDRLSAPAAQAGQVRMGVFFLPPKVAAGALGHELPPGTCSFRGNQVFGPSDPGGIHFEAAANARAKPMLSGSVGPLGTAAERFPDAETIPAYLKDPSHYWRFTAVNTHRGHFQATAHQHWNAGSERIAGTAANPSAIDDSVRATPADAPPAPPSAAAKVTQGDIDKGLPGESPGHAVLRPAEKVDPNLQQLAAPPRNLFQLDDRAIIIVGGKQTTAGEAKRAIETELRAPGPVRSFSVTPRKTPAQLPNANTPLIDPPGTRGRAAQPILGQAPVGRAGDLGIDCTRNAPRIGHVQGRVTPGARFAINGMCFGSEPGYIEIIGQFAGGSLRPPFHEWRDHAIVVEMPDLRGIADHTIAVSVRRAGDRRQSTALKAHFVARRESVEVPIEWWTPTGSFFLFDPQTASGGAFGSSTSFGPNVERRASDFRVRVNPACALETLDVPATVGAVHAVNGWERGPHNEAHVQIVWSPRCTIHSLDYVVATQHERYCSVQFELKARAACPAGVGISR
jgi:hypothetical protein